MGTSNISIKTFDGSSVIFEEKNITPITSTNDINSISVTDNYLLYKDNSSVKIFNLTEEKIIGSVSGENIVAAITNDASYCAVYDSSNNVNAYDISNNTKHIILENNSSTQIDISNANIEISDDGLTIASHQATTWDLSTNAVELLFNTLKDLSANITESGNSKTVKISINNIKVLKYNILIDSSNLYHNSQLSTPYIELVFKNTNLFGDPTSVNDLSKTLVELNVHTPNNGSVDINNPLTTLITSTNKEGITKSVSNTNSHELGDYFTHSWQILDIKFGITIESLNVGCIACSYYNDSSFNSNILINGIEKIVDSTQIYERSGTGNLPAISVFKTVKTEFIQTKVLKAPPTHIYKKYGSTATDYTGMIMAINDDATFITYTEGVYMPIQSLYYGGDNYTQNWKTVKIGSNLSVARINSTSPPQIEKEDLSPHTGTSTWDYVKNNNDYKLTRQLDEIEKRINQYVGSANAVVSKNHLTRAYIDPENPGYLIIDTRNNNTDDWEDENAIIIETDFTLDYIINLDHNGKTLVFAGRPNSMATDGKIFICKSENNWEKLLYTNHNDYIVYENRGHGAESPNIALNGKGDTLLVSSGGGPWSTGANIYKINNNSFELFHTMENDTIPPGPGTNPLETDRGIFFQVAINKDYTFIVSAPWDEDMANNDNKGSISLFSSFRFQTERDISTNTFPTNIHSSQAIPISVRDLSSGYTKFHVSSSDEALFDPNNKEVVAFGLNNTSTSNFRRNYQLRPTLGFYVGDTVKIKPMPQGENQKAALGFVPLQYTKSYFERDTANNNFINPFVPLGDIVAGPTRDYSLGFSVAANAEGNVFITGGPYLDSQDYNSHQGVAVVYELSGGNWIQKGQQIGKGSHSFAGGEDYSMSPEFTLETNEYFGYGVGMNDIGTIVAVGSNKQKVRIFEYKNVDGIIKWHGIGIIVLPTGAGRRISLSSDGYTIAITDDESGKIYIYKYSPDTNPDTNNWTEYATPSASGVKGASLSKDGKRFAYGDTLKKVRIFEYNTSLSQWEKKQEISGPASFGYSVKFNYDGTVLAIGAQNIVRVYKQDPVTANYEYQVEITTGHTIANNMLSINAAGNVIAIGQPHNSTLMSTGKQVQVYQLIDNTWTNLQTKYSNEIELGGRIVNYSKSFLAEALCLNGLGTRIYIGKQNYWDPWDARGAVDVYDINLYKNVNTPTMLIEGNEIMEPSRPEEKFNFVLNDSINFKIEKNYVRITLDTGSHQDSTSTLLLASGSKDNNIKLWSIERDGTVPTDYDPQILTEHSNYVFSVAFSPDGKLLASASKDNNIKLWSIDRNGTATFKQTLRESDGGHTDNVYAVAFSPDGKLLASGSRDKTVKLWSIERNGTATLRDTLTDNSTKVFSVAFSPDGKLLASGAGSGSENGEVHYGEIKIWSIARDGSATLIDSLGEHISWVNAVAFSPDGKLLASGSGDNTVKVWSIQRDGTATVIDSLEEHGDWVGAVAFSPDGKLLASGASDNKVKLWSIKRNGTTTSIQKPAIDLSTDDWVRGLAFSPDGKLLASGSGGHYGGIKIWSIEGDYPNISPESSSPTFASDSPVYGLAFRPTEITITTIPLDNIKPPFAFEYSAYNLDFASTYKIVREGKIPEKPLFALSAAGNCLAINNQSTVEIYDYSFNNWFNTYTIKDIRSNAIYDYSFNNRFNTYTMKDICSNATEIESISMEQKDNLLIKYNTYNRYINNNTIFDYGTRSDIYRRDSSSNWNKESVLEEEKVIDKLSKFGSRVILKDGLISSNSLQITINPNGSEVPIHLIEEPRIYQVGDVTLGWQGWVTSPLPIDSLIAVRVTIKDMFFDPTGGNSVHTVGQAIMGFAKSDILNTITTPYFNTSSNDSTNITLRSKTCRGKYIP